VSSRSQRRQTPLEDPSGAGAGGVWVRSGARRLAEWRGYLVRRSV